MKAEQEYKMYHMFMQKFHEERLGRIEFSQEVLTRVYSEEKKQQG